MRPLILRIAIPTAAIGLVAFALLVPVQSVTSQPVSLYLDLATPSAPGIQGLALGDIPPNGAGWHELYPSYCRMLRQDDYRDNGDGVISACDVIKLDGMDYHVKWAGPTYFTTCEGPGLPPTQVVFEPTGPPNPAGPVCEIWHEVWPQFCQEIHVDSYHDNGDGVLSECDVIDVQTAVGTLLYHIDRIGCNIVVEPGGSTPNDRTTWGILKKLFQG